MKATKQATPGTSGRSAPARGKFGKICLVLLLLATAVFCGFAPRAWAEPVGCWTDVDEDGKPLYADTSWYDKNPEAEEYDLLDAADLAGLAYLVNNCKDYFIDFETGSPKIVRLRAAVDMSAHYWEPIGTFMTAVDDEGTIQDTTPGFVGIFDGGRYAISGISVKRDKNPAKNVYAGFFGSTAFNSNMPGVEGNPVISPMLISINIVDATIEGGLEEFSSKGSNNIEITREPLAAGIVALAHGTDGTRIHDCTFSGSVNGYDAAGIVGQNNGGYVYTSVNMGAVSAVRYAGGIVARDFYRGNKGVTQCTNEGMITSDFAAGGITGIHGASTVSDWSPSQINNCASTGPVVGAKYSGAIAGYTVRSVGGDYSTCYYWLSEGSKATSSLGGHNSESFSAPKEAVKEDTLAGMPPTTVILDCENAPFGRMEDYSTDPARYVHPDENGIYTLGPLAVYPTGSAAAENMVVSEYAVFKPNFTLSRTHLTREEYSEAYKACLTDYTGEDGYVRLRIYSEDDGRMEDTRAGAGTGTLLRYTEYNTDPWLLVEKIIAVPAITLSGATLKAGETAVLTASFDPDATPQSARGLKWSSDNESVATVDASGKVTAVGVGQARITAVSEVFEETPEAECVVTVNKNDVQIEGVALDKTAIEITTGNTAQLSASVLPEGSPQGVTWSSSNSEVASVDEAGLVTAIAEGTAVVTATSSADSSKFASCTVTVVTGDTPPEPAKDPVVNIDGVQKQSVAPTVSDTELPEGVTVTSSLSPDKENAALDALNSGGETGTPHIDGIDQTEPGAVNALTTFSLNVEHEDGAGGDLTITLTLTDAINVAEGSSLYAFIPYSGDPHKFGSFICTPATGEITSVTFTVTGYARFFSEAPVILAAVKGSAPQPAPSGGGGGGGGCSAGLGALALLAVVPLFARRKK